MSLYIADVRVDTMESNAVKDEIRKCIYNSIYPIGAIYTSLNTNAPTITLSTGETYGSWKKINDGLFLRSGTSFRTTGGASTVKLTVANLPSHAHGWGNLRLTGTLWGWRYNGTEASQFRQVTSGLFSNNGATVTEYGPGKNTGVSGSSVENLSFDWSKGSWSGQFGSTGSDGAHNNLPKYRKVAMYERIG